MTAPGADPAKVAAAEAVLGVLKPLKRNGKVMACWNAGGGTNGKDTGCRRDATVSVYLPGTARGNRQMCTACGKGLVDSKPRSALVARVYNEQITPDQALYKHGDAVQSAAEVAQTRPTPKRKTPPTFDPTIGNVPKLSDAQRRRLERQAAKSPTLASMVKPAATSTAPTRKGIHLHPRDVEPSQEYQRVNDKHNLGGQLNSREQAFHDAYNSRQRYAEPGLHDPNIVKLANASSRSNVNPRTNQPLGSLEKLPSENAGWDIYQHPLTGQKYEVGYDDPEDGGTGKFIATKYGDESWTPVVSGDSREEVVRKLHQHEGLPMPQDEGPGPYVPPSAHYGEPSGGTGAITQAEQEAAATRAAAKRQAAKDDEYASASKAYADNIRAGKSIESHDLGQYSNDTLKKLRDEINNTVQEMRQSGRTGNINHHNAALIKIDRILQAQKVGNRPAIQKHEIRLPDGTIATRGSKASYTHAVMVTRNNRKHSTNIKATVAKMTQALEDYKAAYQSGDYSKFERYVSSTNGRGEKHYNFRHKETGQKFHTLDLNDAAASVARAKEINARNAEIMGKPVRPLDPEDRSPEAHRKHYAELDIKHRQEDIDRLSNVTKNLDAGPEYSYEITRWSKSGNNAQNALSSPEVVPQTNAHSGRVVQVGSDLTNLAPPPEKLTDRTNETGEKPLEQMTLAELRQIARNEMSTISKLGTRAALIAAIRKQRQKRDAAKPASTSTGQNVESEKSQLPLTSWPTYDQFHANIAKGDREAAAANLSHLDRELARNKEGGPLRQALAQRLANMPRRRMTGEALQKHQEALRQVPKYVDPNNATVDDFNDVELGEDNTGRVFDAGVVLGRFADNPEQQKLVGHLLAETPTGPLNNRGVVDELRSAINQKRKGADPSYFLNLAAERSRNPAVKEIRRQQLIKDAPLVRSEGELAQLSDSALNALEAQHVESERALHSNAFRTTDEQRTRDNLVNMQQQGIAAVRKEISRRAEAVAAQLPKIQVTEQMQRSLNAAAKKARDLKGAGKNRDSDIALENLARAFERNDVAGVKKHAEMLDSLEAHEGENSDEGLRKFAIRAIKTTKNMNEGHLPRRDMPAEPSASTPAVAAATSKSMRAHLPRNGTHTEANNLAPGDQVHVVTYSAAKTPHPGAMEDRGHSATVTRTYVDKNGLLNVETDRGTMKRLHPMTRVVKVREDSTFEKQLKESNRLTAKRKREQSQQKNSEPNNRADFNRYLRLPSDMARNGVRTRAHQLQSSGATSAAAWRQALDEVNKGHVPFHESDQNLVRALPFDQREAMMKEVARQEAMGVPTFTAWEQVVNQHRARIESGEIASPGMDRLKAVRGKFDFNNTDFSPHNLGGDVTHEGQMLGRIARPQFGTGFNVETASGTKIGNEQTTAAAHARLLEYLNKGVEERANRRDAGDDIAEFATNYSEQSYTYTQLRRIAKFIKNGQATPESAANEIMRLARTGSVNERGPLQRFAKELLRKHGQKG